MSNENLVETIKRRAFEKMDNFEDCRDEIKYLSMLDQDAFEDVSHRYWVNKKTTGYAVKDFRHKLKLFFRTIVG